MLAFVLDTSPLLELVITDYRGPGAAALLKKKRQLSPVDLNVLTDAVLTLPCARLTTDGVVSEVEHHVENVLVKGFPIDGRKAACAAFFKFFVGWLLEKDFEVATTAAAQWNIDCVSKFGPTDAGVVALSSAREAIAILTDVALDGWCRTRRLSVSSIGELETMRR